MMTGGWLPFQDGGAAGHVRRHLSAEELYTRVRRGARRPMCGSATRRCPRRGRRRDRARARAGSGRARPPTAQQFALGLAEVTPSDGYAPSGIEIVRTTARELLDISDMLDTLRSPHKPGGTDVTTLASRYQNGAKLGTGGMADVYAGTSVGAEGFARPVAIKRVLPGFSEMPEFAAMFVDEARLASRLDHPNIVSVLDFDRDAEGRLFLVMELVDGMDLATLAASGLLPPGVVIFAVSEVLRGLGFAHRAGVVHRDVSPHNALLSWDGAVKVSDFGIAKARDASTGRGSEVLKGKPGYMSPEQANSEPLDGRSDLFAVGVVLWELLTGQRLFQGSMREVLAQVMFREITRPSVIRPGVRAGSRGGRRCGCSSARSIAGSRRAEDAVEALAACADAPRDGRGELVRTMTARFPIEAERARAASGNSVDEPAVATGAHDRRAGRRSPASAPAQRGAASFVATASAPLGVPAPYSAPQHLPLQVTSTPISGVAAPRSRHRAGRDVGIALGALIAVGVAVALSRTTPAGAPSGRSPPRRRRSKRMRRDRNRRTPRSPVSHRRRRPRRSSMPRSASPPPPPSQPPPDAAGRRTRSRPRHWSRRRRSATARSSVTVDARAAGHDRRPQRTARTPVQRIKLSAGRHRGARSTTPTPNKHEPVTDRGHREPDHETQVTIAAGERLGLLQDVDRSRHTTRPAGPCRRTISHRRLLSSPSIVERAERPRPSKEPRRHDIDPSSSMFPMQDQRACTATSSSCRSRRRRPLPTSWSEPAHVSAATGNDHGARDRLRDPRSSYGDSFLRPSRSQHCPVETPHRGVRGRGTQSQPQVRDLFVRMGPHLHRDIEGLDSYWHDARAVAMAVHEHLELGIDPGFGVDRTRWHLEVVCTPLMVVRFGLMDRLDCLGSIDHDALER